MKTHPNATFTKEVQGYATATLYIRVSTDEQAICGHSQRIQLDRLTKFCSTHDIEILDQVFEDHSAKTFERPAWSSMMTRFKHNKHLRPDWILFTKWDRFSRNIADAYYMIAQLQQMGVQLQAIDQDIDLSIPENKIVLGVYLATSEVENDRRSINVKQGIHKARQEGYWTAHVPLGYKSHKTINGKRSISPSEPQASIIRKAFMRVGENQSTLINIYRQLLATGLQCSHSNFCRILRNPVYCGKITVPAFENEAAYLTKGRHEPLISELLFEKVQKILNHHRFIPQLNHVLDEALFLRGFFYCPDCNKLLTGSASRGKSGRKYYYYHCLSSCGFRVRADRMNQLFLQRLEDWHIDEAYLDLYKEILLYTNPKLQADKQHNRNTTVTSINRMIERIVHAKELLLKGEIDEEDYLLIKADGEQRIHTIGMNLQQEDWIETRRKESLKNRIAKLSDMKETFNSLTLQEKRTIMKSFLCERPVMSHSLKLNAIIKPGIQKLLGFNATAEQIKYDKNHYLFQEWAEPFLNKITDYIVQIEKGKKSSISRSETFEIMAFFAAFAKLTNKTEK